MHRVRLLRHHHVEPFIVFDGGPLPAKAGTETDRLEKRETAKRKAVELKRAGRTKEAFAAFSQCVDVNPEMALQLIKVRRPSTARLAPVPPTLVG
jgi:exonuclease-1